MLSNVKKIIEKIRENSRNRNELEQFVKNAKWSEKNEPEIIAAAHESEVLKIENAILHDNARRELFNAVMPIVLEVLKKYEGKPYGEKTKAKISDEVKARCNCAVYLRQKEIHIIPLNDEGFSGTFFSYNDFEIYSNYSKELQQWLPVLHENKIVVQPLKVFHLDNCGEYVDDPRARAELLIDSFQSLKEKRDELEKEISAFNKKRPSKIEHINFRNFRNWLV